MVFQKLKGGELSDKVWSWRAAIKRVTWQRAKQVLMFTFCSCNLTELKCHPEDTHKLPFRLYIITYRLFMSAKLTQKLAIFISAYRLMIVAS